MVFFIPIFGYLGAAYAVVLAFILMSMSIYFRTNKIYPISYNWRGVLYPIFFLIVIQFHIDDLVARVFISILYPALWYAVVINKEEKTGLKRLFK